MRRFKLTGAALGVSIISILYFLSATAAAQDELRTFRQARKSISVSTTNANACTKYNHLYDVRVTPTTFSFSGAVSFGGGFIGTHEHNGLVSINFIDIKKVQVYRTGGGCDSKNAGGGVAIELKSHQPARFLYIVFAAREAADEFANALNWLVSHGGEERGRGRELTTEQFANAAAQWRALTPKPPMDEYDAALDAYPTWPEGQFNAALLCGETGDYEEAIQHMHNYLTLAPDAPYAPAARDKIVVWRDKLGH